MMELRDFRYGHLREGIRAGGYSKSSMSSVTISRLTIRKPSPSTMYEIM